MKRRSQVDAEPKKGCETAKKSASDEEDQRKESGELSTPAKASTTTKAAPAPLGTSPRTRGVGAAAAVAGSSSAAPAAAASAVSASPYKNKGGLTPLTPHAEDFKLLSEDLSPFGVGGAGASGNRGQQHLSPLIPLSQSKSSTVPSSREWFTSSSSEGSNEWSNSMPEFSFSEAGSPGLAPGIGFAAVIGRRPTRGSTASRHAVGAAAAAGGGGIGEANGELDATFGALFADGSAATSSSRHGYYYYDQQGAIGSSSASSRRRKKGKVAYDLCDVLDLKGSSLTITAPHVLSPENADTTRCNCKRSKCLKLYCDCLRVNKFCEGCNCSECNNTATHLATRTAAVSSIMERNPDAFKARFLDGHSGNKEHLQGCHCRKSACLKKYCECFSAGASCTDRCKCVECCNGGTSRRDKDEDNAGVREGTKKSKRQRSVLAVSPN